MNEKGESNICTFCGKKFLLYNCLKIHKVGHAVEWKKSQCAIENLDRFEWKNSEQIQKGVSGQKEEKEREGCDSAQKGKFHGWKYECKKVHNCIVCQRDFKIKGSLKTHMLHHAKRRPLICRICKKSFVSIVCFKTHMRNHDAQKNLQCPNCKRIFYRPESYEKHILKGLRSEYSCVKRPLCVHCKEVFLSDELLQLHACQKTYHCNTCMQSFSSCKVFRNHAESHTLKCFDCDRVFSSVEKLHNHDVICPICQRTFESHPMLKKHKRNHLREERCQCEICGKICNKKSFNMHMRKHKGDTPYKCEKCGDAFVTEFYLKKHMKTHSDQKDYGCTICDRRFSQKQNLLRHYRIHTGEKPYECPHCWKKFAWSDLLEKHVKKCKQLTIANPVKPAECESVVFTYSKGIKNCEKIITVDQFKDVKDQTDVNLDSQIIVTSNEELEALQSDQITLIVPKIGLKIEKKIET